MGFFSKLFSAFRPHETSWEIWDDSVHKSEGQPSRMQRALTQNLIIGAKNRCGKYMVTGSSGNIYQVDFESCTCKDFERRMIPCKHMYALAIKESGFNPVPFIIRSGILAHPLRGYMNMGRFRVKGKNPTTNRQNSKIVYAVDESAAIKEVSLSYGLVEPFSVDEMDFPSADVNLISKATSLGVYVPYGAKKQDVEASIQRYTDYDETTISKAQWELSASNGILISALSGPTASKAAFRDRKL